MKAAMKFRVFLLLLIQLLAMSCAKATHDLSHEDPSVFRTIQQTVCFPSSPDAKNWPVKVIYLHGLFRPNTDSDYYGTLEANNRDYLEGLAQRLQLKIAVPVSTTVSSGGFRMWNGVSLSKIESMASTACGGAPLANTRALIGFSNGGYAARNISYLPCNQSDAYMKLLAIGFPETDGGSCGNYVHVVPHAFPPADKDFFDNELAGLGAASLVSLLVPDYRR